MDVRTSGPAECEEAAWEAECTHESHRQTFYGSDLAASIELWLHPSTVFRGVRWDDEKDTEQDASVGNIR